MEKKRASVLKGIVISIVCLVLVGMMVVPYSLRTLVVSATDLSKGYSRKTADTGEVSEEFKTAMADFSFNLFRGLVTKDDDNDLISPLSAIVCLAMIANGADGETKLQMEQAFGMDVETLNKSLYAFTSSLYRAKDCKLNLADSIWFKDDDTLQINEDFLQINADWFDAQIYAAPFDQSTVKDINAWCKHYTDGMVDKIIDRIDGGTLMYIINALTFDAKWATKYEKEQIEDGLFTNYDGEQKTVKMLSSKEATYLSAEGVRGFAKNYAGNKYSIVALLPDEGTDIYDYIATLDGRSWLSLWNTRRSSGLSVKMPEFTYSSNMRLNDVLKSMGMTDMFDGKADFSKLGYSRNGNIYCSEVCQKTFIQVDRNGTKAAAITWGAVKDAAYYEPLSIILDRPFVYCIVDNATGLPIFIGAVTSL